MRSVDKWVGKTDDSMPPPRVRLRIFLAHDGVCAESGVKIQPGQAWDLDHRIPLALGGANDEDNLQPVLVEAHKEKTRRDVAAKAKADRIRKRHLGIESPSKRKLPGGRDSAWKFKVGGGRVPREPR